MRVFALIALARVARWVYVLGLRIGPEPGARAMGDERL